MSLLALALPVLTTLGACSSEQTSNWPALEQESSAHFRYWVRSDDSELCPGITDDLERHRQALLDYLVGTQSDSVIDYYKFRDAGDLVVNAPCVESELGPSGCEIQASVFSDHLLEQHELVHAYTWSEAGSAHFLEEGLTDSLSCGLAQRTAAGNTLDALIAWVPNPKDVTLYADASLLVSYLLRFGGPEAFVRLYGLLHRGASSTEVESAFQTVYATAGQDLYTAAQSQAGDIGCVRVWECTGQEWDTSQSGLELASGCGLSTFTPFEVTAPSVFVGVADQLLPCGAAFALPSPPSVLSEPIVTALEPGRYTIGLPGDSLRNPNPTLIPATLSPSRRWSARKRGAPPSRSRHRSEVSSRSRERPSPRGEPAPLPYVGTTAAWLRAVR